MVSSPHLFEAQFDVFADLDSSKHPRCCCWPPIPKASLHRLVSMATILPSEFSYYTELYLLAKIFLCWPAQLCSVLTSHPVTFVAFKIRTSLPLYCSQRALASLELQQHLTAITNSIARRGSFCKLLQLAFGSPPWANLNNLHGRNAGVFRILKGYRKN